jgi:pectin methylesterase-like acyl-CoA thioesterase
MKENMKKLTVLVVAVVMGALISLGGGLALAKAPLVVDNDKVECPKAAFTTIQAAVNAATPGDTIRVCAGVYAENVVIGPTKSGISVCDEITVSSQR